MKLEPRDFNRVRFRNVCLSDW